MAAMASKSRPPPTSPSSLAQGLDPPLSINKHRKGKKQKETANKPFVSTNNRCDEFAGHHNYIPVRVLSRKNTTGDIWQTLTLQVEGIRCNRLDCYYVS